METSEEVIKQEEAGLRVVHGVRMSQQEQVETREVQTGNKGGKKSP